MRMFLSWSGELSKAVAVALAKWLPQILPSATPWMSEHDIRAGAVWEDELVDNLDATDCGVLALTRENQTAPWLLFEAGVLSKSANRKRVIPYRVDLVLGEVAAPLTRFQGVDADLVGTNKLVLSLNTAPAHPMPDKHVDVLFDALWPLRADHLNVPGIQLLDGRKEITLPPAQRHQWTATPSIGAVRRSPEEYLQEILSLLRGTETPRRIAVAVIPES